MDDKIRELYDFREVNAHADQFQPIPMMIQNRKDCAIAVFHMWKYAAKHLDVHQVFEMVNRWASEQPEREETMKVIMCELVKKYCPHYTISVVEHDPEYQEALKEHRELAQMAMRIQGEAHEQTMSDEAWGSGDTETALMRFMRDARPHREERKR